MTAWVDFTKPGVATTLSIYGVGGCFLAAAVKHSKTGCNPLRSSPVPDAALCETTFWSARRRDVSSQFSCLIARSGKKACAGNLPAVFTVG